MNSILRSFCLGWLGLGACSLSEPAPPAEANAPALDPLVTIRPHLPFRTMSARIHRGVLRIDAENRYMTYDFHVGDTSRGHLMEQMRISWDGQKLYLATSLGSQREIPGPYAQRVGQLLDELQAGAPNLQFTEELPPDITAKEVPSRGWDDRRPYKGNILEADTHPPYHEAVRQVKLDLQSGLVFQGIKKTCEDGQSMSVAVHRTWTVPQDGDTLSRLAAARQACTKMRFTMGMRGRVSAPERGQRACYGGMWRVWSDASSPPTELWSERVQGCVYDGGFDIDPYDVEQQLPLTAPLDQLRVTFDGQLNIRCSSRSPKWAKALVDFETSVGTGDVSGVPKLEWNCWPGWEMDRVYSRHYPEYEAWATP